jgi:23S rRNA U2552 (ribose-2'-O)-methylase RlmE/FtsJ
LINIPEIKKLKGSFNLVISDIAPNLSGIGAIDNENIYDLNQLTVMIAKDYLSIDGAVNNENFSK